jgi:hypothetical protein
VIEDLDGATSEPSRRTHVAVLSAASAAVALVLLYVLLAPAPLMDTRQLAASPTPSPTSGTGVTFASGTAWVRSGQVSQIREVVTSTPCFIAFGSNPPAQLIVVDRNGQPMATYASRTVEPLTSPRPEYWGEIFFTLPCDRPDASAPRIIRAR